MFQESHRYEGRAHSGSNIGEIAIEYDQKKDWDRPFFIDDFTAKTVDREKVTFNVKSNKDGESVEGATLAIGNDTYTVPANGKVEAYYLPGTYAVCDRCG